MKSELWTFRPDSSVPAVVWEDAGFATNVDCGVLEVIGPPDYRKYIRSVVWAAKRRKAFAVHGRKCHKCGTERGSFQVHHLHYENLGRECVETDLRPICTDCHPEEDRKRSRSKGLQTWARKVYGSRWAYRYTLSQMEAMFDEWLEKKRRKKEGKVAVSE